MCVIFWTVSHHPKYRFVFAGNRDEFFARPAAKAHFWPEPNQNVLAGTDLENQATPLHNGTWLGITRNGRFAALTNFREAKNMGARSRGVLVRDFLTAKTSSVRDYMQDLQPMMQEFSGFNLVCFDLLSQEGAYITNRRHDGITYLKNGDIYGLSNSTLDDPWPKVRQGCQRFEEVLAKDRGEDELVEELFNLLSMTKPFSDTSNMETTFDEIKSRIFIPHLQNPNSGQNSAYGTRTGTVVLVDHEGQVVFVERDHCEFKGADLTPPDNKTVTFRFTMDENIS
ncbi:hypothetical protein DFQ28_002456 [Apophysomyces sp. BC1034]|nr:hypothetical protein DFQ30_001093 [Apophysomyces sp. BC1015]KAG0170413.1 hypothetical protein DFQ29_009302 [Apophysomyces sp. BC1021]KAG0190144.1 hypothetical protein DFQ28_002456 [Apophysomyces sp. BC1034]